MTNLTQQTNYAFRSEYSIKENDRALKKGLECQ